MEKTNNEQLATDDELRIKDGILVVDKEPGPSSFKVVEKIKGLIRAKK